MNLPSNAEKRTCASLSAGDAPGAGESPSARSPVLVHLHACTEHQTVTQVLRRTCCGATHRGVQDPHVLTRRGIRPLNPRHEGSLGLHFVSKLGLYFANSVQGNVVLVQDFAKCDAFARLGLHRVCVTKCGPRPRSLSEEKTEKFSAAGATNHIPTPP